MRCLRALPTRVTYTRRALPTLHAGLRGVTGITIYKDMKSPSLLSLVC